MKKLFISLLMLPCLFMLSSCSSSPAKTGIGNSDPASYGLAKKKLVKGKTTQQDVIQIFGAPNITTKGTNGVAEVWTYEKVSSDYVDSQVSVGAGGGLGGGGSSIGGGGGLFGGYGKQKGSSSVRTVTLIIKFDDNEIVSDYNIMETNF
jgi:outer membrane protein assembly factor BamE (lipoprotein component of BamABCDE complex)